MLSVAVLLAGQLAVASLGAPSSGALPAGSSSSLSEPQTDEASALAAARATGTPVEVAGMRSETQQVFANPDGTFQAQINLRPVRVRRADGSWVPTDTTLSVRPDGTVAPGATTVDMAFSGGGSTAPLASISHSGRSLSLSWPGELPAPALVADTATYTDVWPGVDLVVVADVDGFSERLVIKTQEAAANPELATVRFGVQTSGVQLSTDSSGNLRAVEPGGATVFRAPKPMMWDTATTVTSLGETSTAPEDSTVPGEHVSEVDVQVDATEMALTPNQSILTGADTVFPVVVDPQWTYGISAWTTVNAQSPDSATWRTDPVALAAGYQDFVSPWSRVRTFMRFNLDSRIWSTQIRSATLNMFETWSSSCTARAVELWVTGGFSSSTTWNHQPTWGSHLANQIVAYGHDPACPSHGVEFNVTSGIAGAAKNHTGITFGLKAGDENDHLGWKKFSTNPTVTVTYNHPPSTPTASVMSTTDPNTACVTSKTSAPHANVGLKLGLKLNVVPKDPDGNRVRVNFDFRKDFGTSPLAAPTSGPVNSGSLAQVTVMKDVALTNGQLYAWKAYVQDLDSNGVVMSNSSWSQWCYLLQDSTAPSQPLVSSTAYPTDAYAGGAGQPGLFTFTPGSTNDLDITSYCWGMDRSDAPTCVAAAADHTGSVQAAPPSYGPHDLWVRAKDAAGNSSSPIAYHFYANAATDAIAHWSFDEGTGTTTTGVIDTDPSSTSGPKADLSATGTKWTKDGRVNGCLNFDGVSGSASAVASGTSENFIPAARVDTNTSFTATAWVRLTSKADYATAVSQDGNVHSGFYLQYSLAGDHWGMAMQTADATTFSTIRAASTTSPKLDTWTHLAGVFDLPSKQIRLYVDGVLAGTATNSVPWNALGALQIGQAKSNGTSSNHWPGDIDEVRVYNRALTGAEIADLVNHDAAATPAGSWAFDESSGTTAADSSGKNHPVTLGAGATFTPDGHAGGGLSLDGTGAASTSASVVRTDQSFTVAAWVQLSQIEAAATIVSQDGTSTGGFILQSIPDFPYVTLVFALPDDDVPDGFAQNPATVNPDVDPTGVWMHVAAVYDAFTRQLMLRVWIPGNPTYTGYGSRSQPWNATGGVQVGRDRTVDDTETVVYQDFLAGVIDDLRIYSGTLTEADLRALAGQ